MPPLPVMFKTVSTDCNLDCAYCYYRESLEGTRVRRRIHDGMLERFIPQYMEYVSDVKLANLMWHGGEPTLAGLGFFQKIQELEERHASPRTLINNSLQTNGVLLNDAWGEFFAAHHWLVGVSLDGPRDIHDQLRRNRGGVGTFDQVMRGIEVLRRHAVEFNVLCVLGPHNITRAGELMRFYRAEGFTHVQFIPAMDFQAFEPNRPPSFLVDAEEYGEFLVEAFDLWYESGGPRLSVRIFDNFVESHVGLPNDLCVHGSRCDAGIVVEWDGSVYPCDFYVHPSWKLGNVMGTPLREIAESEARRDFMAQKRPLPLECSTCEWLAVCKSGCPRNRTSTALGTTPDYFCASYKRFFRHADLQLRDIATAFENKVRYLEMLNVSRTIAQAGRNDPCPCGSGRKHKHCCASPARSASYILKT